MNCSMIRQINYAWVSNFSGWSLALFNANEIPANKSHDQTNLALNLHPPTHIPFVRYNSP